MQSHTGTVCTEAHLDGSVRMLRDKLLHPAGGGGASHQCSSGSLHPRAQGVWAGPAEADDALTPIQPWSERPGEQAPKVRRQAWPPCLQCTVEHAQRGWSAFVEGLMQKSHLHDTGPL